MAAVRAFAESGRGFVIKEDGLAAGKGVAVHDPEDIERVEPDLARLFDGGPDRVVLIEERLDGREASIIAITDGQHVLGLPAARDHKRLKDGDLGPNTGGMGAYSPVPDLANAQSMWALNHIHAKVLLELARRGSPFIGALYAGVMFTPDGDPILLEFNARFGDPETQVIMPRVAVAMGPLLLAAARGDLRDQVRAARRAGPDDARRGRRHRPRRPGLPRRAPRRAIGSTAWTTPSPEAAWSSTPEPGAPRTGGSRRTAGGSSPSSAAARAWPPRMTPRNAPPTRSRSRVRSDAMTSAPLACP